MQRLTLIAAGLIGALSLSAAARAHGWEQEGGRQDRYEAPRAERIVRYDRAEALRLREAEARREAALRCRREAFRPMVPAPMAARLAYPGAYLELR